MRRIKTIAGLQRRWKARNRRMVKLYRRPYVLQPALASHLEQIQRIAEFDDERQRYVAFRQLPALEQDLLAVDASLSPARRISLAQQDRARKPRFRVTKKGADLDQLIACVLGANPNAKRAKEYWTPFIEHLEALGLAPAVITRPIDHTRESVEYGLPGRRRHLGSGQFQNRVSMIRRKSRSRATK